MESTSRHEALVRRGTALHFAEIPTEAPGPGGLVIAPSFVGVCGTDLQILNGVRPDTGDILGHEGVGIVVETGPGAAMQVGQHVVFNPSAQMTIGRILGHNIPGLFQRLVTLDAKAVQDGLVLPVENEIPGICAALVEPLAGVIYAHELMTRVVPDLRSVLICGAGPVGLLIAQYLQDAGSRVLLVHPSQRRLDTAIALKLVEAQSTMLVSDDLPARVLAWNDGKPLDAAVICTSIPGAPVALRQAIEVLRDGACVEMVTNYPPNSEAPEGIDSETIRAVRSANVCGVPPEGVYVPANIAGRRLVFTGHRGTSSAHLLAAAQKLRDNASHYMPLITHVLPLSRAAGPIQALADSRDTLIDGRDCIKAVVDLSDRAV